VTGTFGAGECVSCVDPRGAEFARGLVNYGAAELQRIKGLHTSAIETVLQYSAGDAVIHRDNLVILA
jgi:glutamate 5-kinase